MTAERYVEITNGVLVPRVPKTKIQADDILDRLAAFWRKYDEAKFHKFIQMFDVDYHEYTVGTLHNLTLIISWPNGTSLQEYIRFPAYD